MKAIDELVKIAFDWYNGGKEIKDEIYNEDWVGMFKNSPKYKEWERVNGVSKSKNTALNLDVVSFSEAKVCEKNCLHNKETLCTNTFTNYANCKYRQT